MLTITHTWSMRSDEEPEKTWNYRTTVVVNDETDQPAVTTGIIDITPAVEPHCDNCERKIYCLREVVLLPESGEMLFLEDLTSCSAFKPKEQK